MLEPDAGRHRSTAWVAAAALGIAVARWFARARVPDDYDSIGFTRALGRFDLAALQPHFPGYPVYVALGRVGTAMGASPLAAVTGVSAIASGLTAAALWRLGTHMSSSRLCGWAAMALWATAWLPWLTGGAALSDATATAWAACAFAGLTVPGRRAATLSAVAMALMLGTRLSYWPLCLSFAWLIARRAERRMYAFGLVGGLLAWLTPFLLLVGPQRLWVLGTTHLIGHFGTFGGSIFTEGAVGPRLWAFVRDLGYDGMVASPWALFVATLVAAFAAGSASRCKSARAAVVVAAPYALWVLVGQNVAAQPRHVLPLVACLCVLVPAFMIRRPLAPFLIAAAALSASLPLAKSRARVAPASAEMARFVAKGWPAPNTVAVFGGRSLRFFDALAPTVLRRTRTWLSEVDVEIERLDILPPTILVTSEVEADARRSSRLSDVATFCRDPRIDRAQPCLTLRRYRRGR